jgi:hypothetical protein
MGWFSQSNFQIWQYLILSKHSRQSSPIFSYTYCDKFVLHRPHLWSSDQSSWLYNGDVLCFLWGMNWIYICYVEESRPPLWSSGQSSWPHNGVILCFLWGTNWIYVYCVEESRPPLWSSGQSSWLYNGVVLCFLWGTNWIYIFYVEESRPSLWWSEFLATDRRFIAFPVRYELNLYMLCRRE